MEFAEVTEPVSLVHPRAAQVAVLSTHGGLQATEITVGTLHLVYVDSDDPIASLSLRVDGSFVTLTAPRMLGAAALRAALEGAIPDGYLVLAHPSADALIVTIARAHEVEPAPQLFCTSFDTTLRARKIGTNRLLLRGVARGKGDLVVRINDRSLNVRPVKGETPLQIAERIRELLADSHITLLTVPTEVIGEVTLTVLPRH